MGDLPQPFSGKQVEARLAQPIVHVVTAHALRDEPQRMPRCQGHRGQWGELVGDLGGRVTSADNDHATADIGSSAPVVGDMQHLPGELGRSDECRSVRVRERSTGGHDARSTQRLAVGGEDDKLPAVLVDRLHASVRPDLDVEPGRVVLEVVGDLVAGGIAIAHARERHPGQRAELRRREQTQAVVVARPRPCRSITGLENQRGHPSLAQRPGGRQPRLAATDDDHRRARLLDGIPPHPSTYID